MGQIKVYYNKMTDILSIFLSDTTVSRQVDVSDDTYINVGANDEPIMLKITHASQYINDLETIDFEVIDRDAILQLSRQATQEKE